MEDLHQHGGKLGEAAAQHNLKPEAIIDFSANINFLGPPAAITEAIAKNLKQIKNYPEVNSKGLKKLIAQKHKLKAEEVVVANGAAEMIYQLAKVLKPKKVMVMAPTFSEYELAAKSVGAQIEYFFLKAESNFKLDLKELEASLTKELDLLFLCNPNNPTAQLIKAAKVENLIKKAAQKEITVVIDEAFIDFLAQPEIYSVVNLLAKYDNLLILKSMTKLFAIPALRLGYVLTNKELSYKLENNRDPWSVNYFAQLAGEIIFKENKQIKKYIKKSKQKIAVERKYLYQKLQQIEALKVYQPTTNYIFIDLSASQYQAAELRQKLAKSALLIRNCDSYRGLNENYIRVAVKSRKENNILLAKLQKMFN